MKKLKKIGHDIALNNFVVHQVTKIAGDRKTGLKLAKSTLKTTTKESAFIALNPQLHSRSATYIKRNGLLIRKITIKSSRPFQCAYHPLTP